MPELTKEIETAQAALADIRAFHQDYLNRRAQRGVRTATDRVMQEHQQALSHALDVLEACKALLPVDE